ncbi:phage antirepressor KilAC domain-containing protein [Streptomyces sp. NBC_01352]|uniref:phage antirepressor KilAC domain-containing protein n=1 Tax=Streptomyces sp. NBC_01352 TaxID=2903834 RepID=UPI002E307B97|nr:phage antirepressor KilAC domain-containing protein [Streptomyces sp. NBC_01352]
MNHDNRSAPVPSGDSGGSSPFDRLMLLDHNGQERWSARDLHAPMGYEKWERFEVAIQRAMAAAQNSGMDPLDHFRGASKVIQGGRWGKQNVADYRLTRYACYLIAMNGDSRKPEIAAAQTYFAVKTREAELAGKPDVSNPEGVVVLAEQYLAAARELVTTRKELAVAKPKASKWDALCNSDGLIEMGAAAKALHDVTGLGRTKFMDLLRSEEMHFLQIQNPRIPYEEHLQKGRAKVKLVPAGYKTVEQTFLTPKGMDWLANRLGVGALPSI